MENKSFWMKYKKLLPPVVMKFYSPREILVLHILYYLHVHIWNKLLKKSKQTIIYIVN